MASYGFTTWDDHERSLPGDCCLKHQISVLIKRLALSSSALLVPLIALFGCSDSVGPRVGGGSVAAIQVSPASPTVAVGKTVQLSATAQDASGSTIGGRTFFWTSSDSSIAAVTAQGAVTGRRVGSAQIAASAEGVSTVVNVTVMPPGVASVTVEPGSRTFQSLSDTARFVASARDADGNLLTGRSIIWTSSDPSVAAVSSTGVVTAVRNGVAAIRATVDGVAGEATARIAQQTARVVLSQSSVSVAVGDTVRLSATVLDAGGSAVQGASITYSSSNTIVAPVTASGLVTGASTGQATITAVSGGVTGQASVSVALTPVGSVIVSPSAATVAAGQVTQLSATVRDERGNVLSGRVVAWSSANPQVAVVDASGRVTGVAAGTVIISAATGGKSGQATITVPAPAPAPVATVSVLPSSAGVLVGATAQLTATLRDSNGNTLTGRAVTWTTSNPSIATVSSSGLVSGVAPGNVTITATSEGKSGTAQISVFAPAPTPVATVTVTPASSTLAAGATTQLTATLRDANGNTLTGRAVTWSSSNASVATVDGNGKVTAVAPGTAIITATSEGKSGTAQVTVTAPPPTPVGSVIVTPSTASVQVGTSTTLTATVRDASGNVLQGRSVTWSSSNTAVASVSSSGVVTGVAAGTATITATSEGKSGTATITVTPALSIRVTPTSAEVQAGQTVQLQATVTGTDAAITWTSSDTNIATVSGTGLVTGVRQGSATITATVGTASATATITVTPAPAPAQAPTVVTNAASSITQTTAVLSGRVNPNGAQTQYRFEVSTRKNLANPSQSNPVTIPANGEVVVSVLATGLSEDTTYYYRVVAENSAGITYGEIVKFDTAKD